MSRVALQPSANSVAQAHYAMSVLDGLEVESLTELTKSQRAVAHAFAQDGRVRLWGAKPGEDGRGGKRWEQIVPGDHLLFSRSLHDFSLVKVLGKFRNEPQARSIWGLGTTRNGHAQAWEYMFVLDAPLDVDLTTVQLNELIGRKPNANVQEFVVLSDEQSERLLGHLRVPMSYAHPPASPQGAWDHASAPPSRMSSRETVSALFDEIGESDEVVLARRRREQAFLREYLLKKTRGVCALCRRIFSAEFLVAAHIKPRKDCSESERLDWEHVAMANCTFGCDQLWGRGLIGVTAEGRITWSSKAPEAGPVREYLNVWLPENEPVALWESKPGTQQYFAAHLAQEFRE